MSDALTLPAETRERAGKGASRALRRQGRIPAVIYGGKQAPMMIHIDAKDLTKQVNSGHFMNSIVMIEVEGKKVRALPKDVAFHPVKDRVIHVDFLRLAKGATIEVMVPVSFVNEEASPGLKRGGVLNVVRHELEVTCDSEHIPDEIVIDLTGLDIGDSIHISSVTLPEHSTIDYGDHDFTIATLVAPSALKAEEEETAEEEGGEAEAAEAEEGGDEDKGDED